MVDLPTGYPVYLSRGGDPLKLVEHVVELTNHSLSSCGVPLPYSKKIYQVCVASGMVIPCASVCMQICTCMYVGTPFTRGLS